MQQSTIELGPHHGSSAAAAYTKSDDEEEQQTLLSSSTVSSSSAAGLRRRSMGRNHQRGSWSHYGGKVYYYLLRALVLIGIAAIVPPFLSYSRSVADRVETETMNDMHNMDNTNISLSSTNNSIDEVEVKVSLTKDDIKQQQIANYIKGTAIIRNIHITHHAGTSVCHQMAKLGPTPGFACMGKWKDNATLEHPWPSDEALETSHIGLQPPEYNDTAAWVTFWRPYFHFKSMEYRHYPKPNLHTTNWEYENLVSMIVMRDPLERFMSGGKCGSFHKSLPDDPTNDTQELYWEYANSACADNYALRVLANESVRVFCFVRRLLGVSCFPSYLSICLHSLSQNCANGEDTSISCLESAKTLLNRFTFILDKDCLADSMVALGNVLNLTITSSGFESSQHNKRDPLRDRFGNDTLYEYVKRRFRRDIELYEWSKKRSIVVCN